MELQQRFELHLAGVNANPAGWMKAKTSRKHRLAQGPITPTLIEFLAHQVYGAEIPKEISDRSKVEMHKKVAKAVREKRMAGRAKGEPRSKATYRFARRNSTPHAKWTGAPARYEAYVSPNTQKVWPVVEPMAIAA